MTYDTEYGWMTNKTIAVLRNQEDMERRKGQS
jgi:hypothetical protein